MEQAIDNHFRTSGHNKALLILDDVCDKKITDKFDFPCKTLVITSDIGVLDNRCHIFVAVSVLLAIFIIGLGKYINFREFSDRSWFF